MKGPLEKSLRPVNNGNILQFFITLRETIHMAKTDTEQSPLSRLDDRIDLALLDARRLFLNGAVDDELIKDIIRKLWYLELTAPGKPITLLINSPGGSITAGLALWDQIKAISSPITTVVTGLAASMGSVLSLAAPRGRRFATPAARIMIHQPHISGVVRGQATDLQIQAEEIERTHHELARMYADATKQSIEVIKKALDRDTWMSAKEAKDFGLIDHIVVTFKDISNAK